MFLTTLMLHAVIAHASYTRVCTHMHVNAWPTSHVQRMHHASIHMCSIGRDNIWQDDRTVYHTVYRTVYRTVYTVYKTVCIHMQVNAWTTSRVQRSLLGIFCRCEAELPNFWVGSLTHESVNKAMDSGISSEEIVAYLQVGGYCAIAADSFID
jgi:hypothetical protein